LPEGYFITMGGQFQAQEDASRLIGLLSLASVALIFLILYSRYKSAVLAAVIMANIPLALVGAVVGLWLSGQPLSVAALVGFITLAGIAVRNGIMKVSHYVNLCAFENETFSDQDAGARLARTPDAGADDGAGGCAGPCTADV
jgi:HME family heavy-metal exporter